MDIFRATVSCLRTLLLCGAVALGAPSLAGGRTLSMPLLQSKPFGWLDAKGQPQGLYPDIVAALARQTGLDIEVEVVPFARAAALVASGSADATLMFRTTVTQGKVVESMVVFHTEQIVLLRPGLHVDGRRGLANLDLGRMNGGCQELAGDPGNVRRFQDLTSQESGLRMLLAGRIDGFCSVNESLLDAMAGTGLDASFADAQRVVLASKPVWLMLSNRLPAEVGARLRQGMAELQRNGELAKIFRSRLGSRYVLHIDS